MVEIEKGFPVPERTHGRYAKYPWRQMEVGDSFFVRGATSTTQLQASGAVRRAGFKYIKRTVDGGVRVWRVE